jgi:hypothetical protein
MGAQFSSMSMQQQAPSAYGGARGAQQGAGYPRQTPGGPAGMPQAPRGGAYGRPMDSGAAPYIPGGVAAAADPYGYPSQQPPQYSHYQQKAPQGYGAAPAGGYAQQGMQQQQPMYGAQHQMRPPAAPAQGYPAANMRYQPQPQGYGSQAMPQPYDPQYFGSPSDTGAEHSPAPAEHSN